MAFRSLFDRSFKYRSSLSTDVRRTFERAKRELRELPPARPTGKNSAKTVQYRNAVETDVRVTFARVRRSKQAPFTARSST